MVLRKLGRFAWIALAAACATGKPEAPAHSAPEPVEAPRPAAPAPEAAEAPENPLAVWDGGTGRRGLSNDGAWRVQYRTIPDPIPLNDEFALELAVFDADGVHAPDVGVGVDAAMPHHRHGMLQVPTVERRADGTFLAQGLLFHMPGYWELYFDVTVDGVTERTQFVVELD